jgi:hypothetical protein
MSADNSKESHMRYPFPVLLAIGLTAVAPARAESLGDLANQVIQQTQHNGALGAALSDSDIATGLKQALAKGTKTAVTQLGRTDGFWGNDQLRIPLPRPIEKASGLLQSAGYGPQVEQLHLSINRAAEQAVPLAADVFSQAVQKLTLDDVRAILNGPPDAATQYFKRTTSDELLAKFEPVVARTTSKIGVVRKYNDLLASTGPLASMIGGNSDLDHFVAQKALDGLFLRVADEEKSIRSNPAARTTDLLKKVFGG